MKVAASAGPLRFSDRHREKLLERFGGVAQGQRFVADLQRLVARHVQTRQGRANERAAAVAMRSTAAEIQKAAKALSRSVGLLDDAQKGLLGQLMWTVDKQRYAPAAFSVDQVATAVAVLGLAAGNLTQAGRGGRPSAQLDALIRGVYAAYVVRFGSNPDLSTARAKDFALALKICLSTAGENSRISLAVVRGAVNS